MAETILLGARIYFFAGFLFHLIYGNYTMFYKNKEMLDTFRATPSHLRPLCALASMIIITCIWHKYLLTILKQTNRGDK